MIEPEPDGVCGTYSVSKYRMLLSLPDQSCDRDEANQCGAHAVHASSRLC